MRALLCGLALWSGSLAAQGVQDSVVMSATIHGGSGEAVWVRLAHRGSYWMSVDPSGDSLEVRESSRSARTALLSPSPTRPGVLELYAPGDGEYQVTAPGLAAGRTTSFRIWTNRDSTGVRAEHRDREWGVGLSVGGGFFTGFSPGTNAGGPHHGHAQVEGGLVIGTNGRLSFLLGAGYQPDVAEDSLGIVVIFGEARLPLLRLRGAGGHAFESGVLVRAGQGNLEVTADDPTETSLGLFISQHLDRRRGTRGLSFVASYLHTFIGNTDVPGSQTSDQGLVSLRWVP